MSKLTISEASNMLELVCFIKWLRGEKNIFLAGFITDDKTSTETIDTVDAKTIRKLAKEFVEGKY